MTFDRFTQILSDCHVDHLSDYMDNGEQFIYDTFQLSQYPDDIPYICLAIPNDDMTYLDVILVWVSPAIRRTGTASELLSSITVSHGMVVDTRSVDMHNLLFKLGYQCQDYFVIENDTRVYLNDGTLYYFKEL